MTRLDSLPPPAEAYAACREHLANYPAIFEQPVVWGEMDELGHVNNIVYFRYFESARMAYFERINFMAEIETTGIGPILAETQCRFRAPLTFPDYLAIGARVSDVDTDRFLMHYAVASFRVGGIAAVGTGRVVSYNYETRSKAPLPETIVRNIAQLESANARKLLD